MLKNEIENRKEIEEFFGTKKPDELVEKKIDFVMDKIGIANRHCSKLGYMEGVQYYLRLQRAMIRQEEREKYLNIYQGYRNENENENQIPETIIVIKKESSNQYYRYLEEEKKFLKIEKETVKKLEIKYRNKEKYNELTPEIERLENRLKEREIE